MAYEVNPTAEVKPPVSAVQTAAPDPPDKPASQAQPYPYYSDIAMTNLFNGYLSLINFERQALRQHPPLSLVLRHSMRVEARSQK